MIDIDISGHAIERWQERVESGFDLAQARLRIKAFLAASTIEEKPRGWMPQADRRNTLLSRSGVQAHDPVTYRYAYNGQWLGVCLVLAMADPPFVVTVVTRDCGQDRSARGYAIRDMYQLARQERSATRRHHRLAQRKRFQ